MTVGLFLSAGMYNHVYRVIQKYATFNYDLRHVELIPCNHLKKKEKKKEKFKQNLSFAILLTYFQLSVLF